MSVSLRVYHLVKLQSLYAYRFKQWCSQDEHVTWAQHRHIQCTCNMHLGKLARAHSHHENYALWDHFWGCFSKTILSVLPICSLHVHMKAITHANNWSLTLAFHTIFTQAPVNFMWAQAWVCPGVPGCSYTTGFKWYIGIFYFSQPNRGDDQANTDSGQKVIGIDQYMHSFFKKLNSSSWLTIRCVYLSQSFIELTNSRRG